MGCVCEHMGGDGCCESDLPAHTKWCSRPFYSRPLYSRPFYGRPFYSGPFFRDASADALFSPLYLR